MGVKHVALSLSLTRPSLAHEHRLFVFAFVLLQASFFTFLPVPVQCISDPSDVQALQVMYTSLNSPPQLTNWKSNGGDPCGEAWKGVSCEGSAVVSIQASGLGLSGSMGYMLSSLVSLRSFDLSNNNIHDTIPYQLPPNLTSLNLASNNLSGNLPYSLSAMYSLSYLNMSGNSLSLSIGDVFLNLSHLTTVDFSFNSFSGDLPSSLSSLSNLSTLNVQNNQLTGSLNGLVGLPLTTLNVANNHFRGWIPQELISIPNFVFNGNSFDNGPAPPPPPFTPPSPGRAHRSHPGSGPHIPPSSDGQSDSDKGLKVGAIIGIALGSVFLVALVLLAIIFCVRKHKTKDISTLPPRGSRSASTNNLDIQMQEPRVKNMAVVTDLKPPPAEKLAVERLQGNSGSVKRMKSPITTTSYTVASLQTATSSFSQEFLIGEGSLGRVYRAEFYNGKIMAVKKIDNATLSLQEEDNFLEVVSNL